MILFIDTHDSLITIGLKNKDDLIIKTKESEFSHSIFTMPLIQEIFDSNNLDIKELDKIIVINGPGSFTGIRIGLSIAKTMAYALNIKINTISSLTAYLISSKTECDKMCVIEDNKGFYISVFDKNNNIIVDEEYVNDNKYNYYTVEQRLDVNAIINYCDKIPSLNVHHVTANYVKKIEVEK